MKTSVFLVILTAISLNIQSQSICSLTDMVKFVHVNNVKAAVGNRGNNFHFDKKASFTVPYSSSSSPNTIYATSLWFGGYDIDQKLLTNILFFRSDNECGYIPGPFTEGTDEENLATAANWNRIFEVTYEEINAHIKDYQDGKIDHPIESIYGWPGKGNPYFGLINGFDLFSDTRAGFYETMDHINGIYEPDYGEYPIVEGLSDNSIPGVILWCVYGGGIFPTQTKVPYEGMKLQIEQTSWAMSCENDILSNTVFTRYVITNKSNSPYSKFRFGLYTDTDLGCNLDDYLGSFPDISSYYVYNMDNEDESNCMEGLKGFGNNPPVQVVTFLGDNGLDGFVQEQSFDKKLAQMEYYNILDGKFPDGTPITFGGNGNNPGSKDTVFYMFPDTPSNLDGWSMYNEGIPSGDKYGLGISRIKQKPDFVFKPDENLKFDIAFSYFRNEGFSNLENVIYAKLKLPQLIELYKEGLPDCNAPVCNCDCVWPGDTDKNGIVNYSDYVNILKSFGSKGPARNKPVAWIGREALDWPHNANSVVNPKYADANGDGSIDAIDLTVVDDLIGKKNICYNFLSDYCEEGEDLIVSNNLVDTFVTRNKLVILNLILKDENNFMGLEYDIKFDARLFRNADEINKILWADSNIKTVFFSKANEYEDMNIHIIQFNDKKANARLKAQDNNLIYKLYLMTEPIPDTFPTQYTQIKVCNAIAHYEDGTMKHLPSQIINLRLPDDVVISGINEPLYNQSDIEIMVSPNPANTEINISFGTFISGEVKIDILDMSGRCIISRPIDNFNQNIDLSSLSQAIYYLRLINDRFIKTEKVVICR